MKLKRLSQNPAGPGGPLALIETPGGVQKSSANREGFQTSPATLLEDVFCDSKTQTDGLRRLPGSCIIYGRGHVRQDAVHGPVHARHHARR